MNEPEDASPRLNALVGELPDAIEPSRDLWPGIEARIGLPRQRRRLSDLALAAGIAALTVSALFVGLSRDGGKREVAPQWAFDQLDTAYRPLREASLVRYRDAAERLDPELRQTVESNLAIIDGALAEIRSALATRPSDAALGQMLQRTYEQELAIIDAVTPPRMVTHEQPRYRGAL